MVSTAPAGADRAGLTTQSEPMDALDEKAGGPPMEVDEPVSVRDRA
jgi:hypothetical protein